jgi:periplasmic divalent cation tolerance protein
MRHGTDEGWPMAGSADLARRTLQVMAKPSDENLLLCYCTCPDRDSAQTIADALVSEALAACVSRVSGMQSTYRWEGSLVSASEELLLIKTTTARFGALQARLLSLHPYEVPELIAVPVVASHEAYATWVRQQVT